MKLHIFTANTEKEKALQDALKLGGVGDRDAVAERQEAVPAPEPVEAGPAVPDAPSSAAALSVAAMLDAGLSPADVREVLNAEERRRAAAEAERERQRADLLRSDAERAQLARNRAERERLEPLLAEVEAQIAEAVAQFEDQRDALLTLAGQLNALDVRHARLFGRLVDAEEHAPGELRARKRCHIWRAEHAITLEQLRRASVE